MYFSRQIKLSCSEARHSKTNIDILEKIKLLKRISQPSWHDLAIISVCVCVGLKWRFVENCFGLAFNVCKYEKYLFEDGNCMFQF